MKELTLAEVHGIELQLLNDFDSFCETHALTYFLAYGTLLGAVRHGGFIPWDDDVDVWMPRADFERFIRVYPETESCKLIEPYSRLFGFGWAKILCKGTAYSNPNKRLNGSYGLTMDVFPLDSGGDEKSHKHHNFIDKFRMLAYSRPKRGTNLYIQKMMLGQCARLLPKSFMNSLCRKQLNKSSSRGDKDAYTNFFSPYGFNKDSMPSNWFGDGIRSAFEGSARGYCIPADYERVLENVYGKDWHTPVVNQPHAVFLLR